MKLPSILAGLSLLAASALSHPLDLPFKITQNEIETLQRRQSGIIDVTGASGSTQPRLEIRQMRTQQPNQFTLLILALQKFQALAQSQTTSYYQIAGIHGVPRQNYNGVGECSSCAGSDGYCTHDSVLFPAWHRAYMALFEQEFVSIAQSIASSWPSSGSATTPAQMQAAASTIRWPYWDWAAIPPTGQNNFPGAVSTSTITINGPTGQQTIANPLYSYHFTSSAKLHYTPFTTWPNTLRYPTSDAASATSNDPSAISAFNNIRASLQDQVYKLFTTCTDYLHFSNDHAGSSTTSCSNSIEGIHNTIHTTTGGVPSSTVKTVGHMYYLSLAGFDPVFWLHHANVDRFFAMWQTLHPSSYGASQVAPHNTWTIAQGSTQGPTSPLTPFYQSGTTFWTTTALQDWTTFHYTYPEFADSDGSQSAIASYVNNLYGPSATATAGSSKRTAAPDPGKAASFSGKDGVPQHGLFPFPKGAIAQNGSSYEYVANIQAPRYALGGSYYIFVFLGPPESESPQSWITDPNLVGPMGVLSQDSMKGKEVNITGSIPLTRALTAKLGSGMLAELTEVLVGPFLKNLLQWRILGPDGSSVDPSNLPGFLVSVYSTTATNPTSFETLPQYSEFIPLPIATHGKKGGLLGALENGLGGLIGNL